MSKRAWIITGISAVALLAVVFFTVLFVQENNKPKKVVDSFTEAVKKKDTSRLKELIDPDKKGTVLNKESMKAFAKYLNTNDSSFDAIKDGLKEQVEEKDYSATNQQVSLIEAKKKWGLFREYKLRVKTGFIKVSGQNEEDRLSLSVDNMRKPVKESKKDTYGPLLPGTYNTVTTVKNELGTFMKKDQVDVWGGSKEVTLIVDPDSLANDDKEVQKSVMSAVDVFNHDWAVFETSSFDTKKLTNVSDKIKSDTSIVAENFKQVKDYVDEVHSQYLGAVINLDDLDVSYFDGKWRAEAEAVVSYNSKMKLKKQKKMEDLSYKAVRDFSMIYNPAKKKWMIETIKEYPANGTEEEWENKEEMKIKDPKLLKWKRKDSSKGL